MATHAWLMACQCLIAEPREYADLREKPPVKVDLPDGDETFLVTSDDDARPGMRDPRLSSDDEMGRARAQLPVDRGLNTSWGMVEPEHGRLRHLVITEFTARRIKGWRLRVQALVDGLFDGPLRTEPRDPRPGRARGIMGCLGEDGRAHGAAHRGRGAGAGGRLPRTHRHFVESAPRFGPVSRDSVLRMVDGGTEFARVNSVWAHALALGIPAADHDERVFPNPGSSTWTAARTGNVRPRPGHTPVCRRRTGPLGGGDRRRTGHSPGRTPYRSTRTPPHLHPAAT